MNRESRPTSLVPNGDKKIKQQNLVHRNSEMLGRNSKMKKTAEETTIEAGMFYESDDSMNVTVVETPKQDGSDSGVEMKCNHCFDLDGDGAFTPSCNSSIISGHSSSPCCGDDDLATSVSNLQIEPNNNTCLSPSCDGASENGSESSSVDSSKMCRSHCAHMKRTGVYYGKPSSYRSSSANGRRTSSPNNNNNNNVDRSKNIQRASPIPKYDACRHKNNTNTGNNSPVSRVRNVELRNRTVRSLSSSRCRTQNEDNKKWLLDGSRFPIKSKPPCCSSSSSTSSNCSNNNATNNNNYNSDSDKSNSIYSTLPRHSKYRDGNGRTDGKSPASREPSLNRAANLRKKFVENNLMTTSLTIPTCSSTTCRTPSSNNNNSKLSKTKIYHEVSTQTSLTNEDLNRIIAGVPSRIITDPVETEDFTQQISNDHEINKTIEERTKILNEELRKLKSENMKQKNVIEWLENELSSNKDEKLKFQTQLMSTNERINYLINRDNQFTLENTLEELERKVNSSNDVIVGQQEEINELRDMCCIMKKDLEKNISIQKSLIETQRATELESLELQEFLQVEKSLLSDSLRDLEAELNCAKEQISKLREEVDDKTAQCSHLVRVSEQQRQENLLLQVRLSHLEHRSKELLVQQGAAISSASVALSSLSTRFDLLLEQLINAYRINDADLEDGIYYNDAYSCSSGSGEEATEIIQENDRITNDKMTETEKCPASRKSFMFALLNAICNAATRSSILKQTVNSTDKNDEETDVNNLVDTVIVTGGEKLSSSKRNDDCSYNNNNNNASVLSSRNSCSLNDGLSKSILTINDDLIDLTNSGNKRNSLPVTLNHRSDAIVTNNNKTEFNISESLNNLSDAILTRQIIEGYEDEDSLKEYLKQDISLVDQVIEIDNTVTRLLKAIRVIQISFNLEQSNDNSLWDWKNLNGDISKLFIKRNMSLPQECNQNDITSDESSPLDINTNPADLLFKVQHQRSVIYKVLKMLRNMRDSMTNSVELQKIHDELESVTYVSCAESPLSPHDN